MAGAEILRAALIGEEMTEDELLAGITEALTFGGWRWTHIRRSDGITQGHSGLPDIIAVHTGRRHVLAWELKTERGQLTPDQLGWLQGLTIGDSIDARVIRPVDYDAALMVILHGTHPAVAFARSFGTPAEPPALSRETVAAYLERPR